MYSSGILLYGPSTQFLTAEVQQLVDSTRAERTDILSRMIHNVTHRKDYDPTSASEAVAKIVVGLRDFRPEQCIPLVLRMAELMHDAPDAEIHIGTLLRSHPFARATNIHNLRLLDALLGSSKSVVRTLAQQQAEETGLDNITAEQRRGLEDKYRLDMEKAERSAAAYKMNNTMGYRWYQQRKAQGRDVTATPPWSWKPPSPKYPDPVFPHAVSSDGVSFRPVRFCTRSDFGERRPIGNISDMIPAGKNVDVARTRNELFAVRENGNLESLWRAPAKLLLAAAGDPILDVGYDGRFLWVSTAGNQATNPYLVLIDPATGGRWTIGRDEGLLLPKEVETKTPNRHAVRALPSGVGKAMVVTSFGRTWIGEVAFQPGQEPTVTDLYEAPETSSSIAAEKAKTWRDPLQAFLPVRLELLGGSPSTPDYLLAFRDCTGLNNYNESYGHPLLLDLRTRNASVIQSELDVDGGSMANRAVDGGVAYSLDPQRGIARYSLPDMQSELAVDRPMQGAFLCEGGRFHVSGERWISGTLASGEVEVDVEPPWDGGESGASDDKDIYGPGKPKIVKLCQSSRYGLVALTKVRYRYKSIRGTRTRDGAVIYGVPYQVVLPGSTHADDRFAEIITDETVEESSTDAADHTIVDDMQPRQPKTAPSDRVTFEALPDVQANWRMLRKCNDGMDMMLQSDKLLIMRTPGKAEIVYSATGKNDEIVAARFDGQYFWICSQLSRIVVATPDGEEVCRFDDSVGLPQYHTPITEGIDAGGIGGPFVHLRALQPGKVLVIGSVGNPAKVWCAILTCSEQSDGKLVPQVEPFFESTDPSNASSKGAIVNFQPAWVRPYSLPGNPRPYFLLGRKTNLDEPLQMMREPLVVNPGSLNVMPLPLSMSSWDASFRDLESYCHNGELLFRGDVALEVLSFSGSPPDRSWSARELPNTEKIRGSFLPHEGKIYIPGAYWYRIEPGTWKVEQLTEHPLPEEYQFREYAISAHYGLVAFSPPGTLYRVHAK